MQLIFGPQLANPIFFRFDPIALLVRAPASRVEWTWGEHPDGTIQQWTNNLGFAENAATNKEKRGLRILVAGDSHTAGVVHPEETFANVLERLLGGPEAGFEVLAAGVRNTGPRCYLGMLRRQLYLEPDVFVAALFSGNDFADDLRLFWHLHAAGMPTASSEYWPLMEKAMAIDAAPISQGLNQVFRFKNFPDDRERALELVVDSYERMNALCAAQGILFQALVIPSKNDVDLTDGRDPIERCIAALELSPAQAGSNRELAERFVAAMRAREIPCLDLTPAMTSANTPYFWRRDHHLNVAGNELAARLLFEALEKRL